MVISKTIAAFWNLSKQKAMLLKLLWRRSNWLMKPDERTTKKRKKFPNSPFANVRLKDEITPETILVRDKATAHRVVTVLALRVAEINEALSQ